MSCFIEALAPATNVKFGPSSSKNGNFNGLHSGLTPVPLGTVLVAYWLRVKPGKPCENLYIVGHHQTKISANRDGTNCQMDRRIDNGPPSPKFLLQYCNTY